MIGELLDANDCEKLLEDVMAPTRFVGTPLVVNMKEEAAS
jgi:hypothetical protein